MLLAIGFINSYMELSGADMNSETRIVLFLAIIVCTFAKGCIIPPKGEILILGEDTTLSVMYPSNRTDQITLAIENSYSKPITVELHISGNIPTELEIKNRSIFYFDQTIFYDSRGINIVIPGGGCRNIPGLW